MPPRAPAHIVASIESDYYGLISTKNIVTRHPEVAQYTIYSLIKNLKEHRAAYPILYAEPQPFGRPQLITPRAVSGQDHPTEPDDLAISKLARATIANA